MSVQTIKSYRAWDLPTRLFHWINVVCVIILSLLGLIMLNKGAIGIGGKEAAIGLKTVHVLVGYVFTLNLLTRIIMGFFGSRHSRWSTSMSDKRSTLSTSMIWFYCLKSKWASRTSLRKIAKVSASLRRRVLQPIETERR